MRQGQSTLEYILLIGIVAVGLIVMLVYVSRGHQGNLRSQADQLSAGQYVPGKTAIANRDSKILKSTVTSGSSNVVKHGDMNKPLERTVGANEPPDWLPFPTTRSYKTVVAEMKTNLERISDLETKAPESWEYFAMKEAVDVARAAADNGVFKPDDWSPYNPLGDMANTELAIIAAQQALNDRSSEANAMWAERESNPPTKPDKTTTTSYNKEKGTITTGKSIRETLGGL
jgi:hypothetical protein